MEPTAMQTRVGPSREALVTDSRKPGRLAWISALLGAVGLVLFGVGALASSTGAFVAGFIAGACSLGVALYWRSELVTSWHVAHPSKRRRW